MIETLQELPETCSHRTTLAIRVDPSNPNHHLWLNNGTWFVHYTVCPTPLTAERVRRSLGTKDLEEARRRRDALFARSRFGVQGSQSKVRRREHNQVGIEEGGRR